MVPTILQDLLNKTTSFSSDFNFIIISYKSLSNLAGNSAQNTEKGMCFASAALRWPRCKESQQWDEGLMHMLAIFCGGFLVGMGDCLQVQTQHSVLVNGLFLGCCREGKWWERQHKPGCQKAKTKKTCGLV